MIRLVLLKDDFHGCWCPWKLKVWKNW